MSLQRLARENGFVRPIFFSRVRFVCVKAARTAAPSDYDHGAQNGLGWRNISKALP
jgi:hypothetical protein